MRSLRSHGIAARADHIPSPPFIQTPRSRAGGGSEANLGGGDRAANGNISLRLIHAAHRALPQHGRFGTRPAPSTAKQPIGRIHVPKGDSFRRQDCIGNQASP
jgi:hypothetical protein